MKVWQARLTSRARRGRPGPAAAGPKGLRLPPLAGGLRASWLGQQRGKGSPFGGSPVRRRKREAVGGCCFLKKRTFPTNAKKKTMRTTLAATNPGKHLQGRPGGGRPVLSGFNGGTSKPSHRSSNEVTLELCSRRGAAIRTLRLPNCSRKNWRMEIFSFGTLDFRKI